MKLKAILSSAFLSTATVSFAQEADAPLQISGSADAYYKYDFSKHANIPTSFASDQNSVSLGMIDLALKKLPVRRHLLVNCLLDHADKASQFCLKVVNLFTFRTCMHLMPLAMRLH